MNYLRIILCLICLSFFACQQQKTISKEGILIKSVTLIPMNGEEVKGPQSVFIKDRQIINIGETIEGINPELTIEGAGKYLMPGLTEMHAHIPVPEDGNTALVEETLFLYLSQGVTTIRGMLGHPYHLSLKELVEEGTILGPRIYTASPSMNGNNLTSPEIAKDLVAQYKKEGYDFLKIHPGINLEVWQTLEATAKEVGIPYAGHVPTAVGIHRALESEYQTIDHLDGYLEGLVPSTIKVDPNDNGFFGYGFTELLDASLISDVVARTKQLGVAVVPTQTLFTRWYSPQSAIELVNDPEMKYMSPKTRYAWRQNKERMVGDSSYTAAKWETFIATRKQLLLEMHRQGVTILLGSDAPQVFNVPGFSIHREMQTMREAGMPNAAILASGTVQPAKFFNAAKEYGSIIPGAVADLILLDKNPLEDIGHTSVISGVMVKGKWLPKSLIDKQLKEIEKIYREP